MGNYQLMGHRSRYVLYVYSSSNFYCKGLCVPILGFPWPKFERETWWNLWLSIQKWWSMLDTFIDDQFRALATRISFILTKIVDQILKMWLLLWLVSTNLWTIMNKELLPELYHFYLRQGGYIFWSVCWLICPSAGLQKNYNPNCHETWWRV